MIDKNKIHEEECFSLILSEKIHGQQSIEFFKSIGLTLEDNFFFLDRSEPEVPWQSISIINIDFYLNDTQVYPDESDVDKFEFSYLFASLPESCFTTFKDIIEKSIEHFKGHLQYNQEPIPFERLDALFNEWKQNLKNELYEEPGAESLAILIQELFYQ